MLKLRTDKKGVLIYIGDPMCSWCWGISPEIEQLINYFENTLDFRLVLGGLRPGGGDEWNMSFKKFLRTHWNHVHNASGQEFNYSLLDTDVFNYDTEPPSRAVRIVRKLSPEQEFYFFKEVQRKFYVGNEDPNDLSFYSSICYEFDIPIKKFDSLFNSDEYAKLTAQDFSKSKKMGVRGYPSLMLKRDGGIELVSYGYAKFEKLKSVISKMISTPRYDYLRN